MKIKFNFESHPVLIETNSEEMSDFFETGHPDDIIAGWFWDYYNVEYDEDDNIIADVTIQGEISFDGETYIFKCHSDGEVAPGNSKYSKKELLDELGGEFPSELEIEARINVLADEWGITWSEDELAITE